MTYTVLDSLEAVRLFYNEVNGNEEQDEFHVTITSIWGEILLDETAPVHFVQKQKNFGEYILHLGKKLPDGGTQYYKWITIDLLVGWLVPKEGAKESIAEIRVKNEKANIDLQLAYEHKETHDMYNHEHTGLEFFDIYYNSYTNYEFEDFDDIDLALMEDYEEEYEDEE